MMADTTVAAKSNVYLAADKEWLFNEFKKFAKAPAIFSFIHIQQRKHNKDGWPAHGVGAADQVEKAEAVMDLLENTLSPALRSPINMVASLLGFRAAILSLQSTALFSREA